MMYDQSLETACYSSYGFTEESASGQTPCLLLNTDHSTIMLLNVKHVKHLS